MIRLGGKLKLPVEIAGEAIAILAKRGAGKTNTAVVLVEELHKAGIQFVVLDPVGVWWGIRSGTEGTQEGGLAVPVLGGPHGDVPLEPTAGELIADVTVETGQSVVVDVSEMSKTQQRSFVAAFAQRLYRMKGQSRSLIHVVLEEADEFAPQRVTAKDAPMVGAVSQLIRRGRSRGIGMTVITQRSASLNKDVLDQADLLIAMRTTGPRDRKAIEGWIDHQDADGVELVLPSLPGLTTGEAWVWNPERSVLDRIQVRRRRTFDTSATPGHGGRRAEPRSVAPIDLTLLGKRIEETAEKAKANDPGALRAKVRDLERRLSSAEKSAVTETVEVEKIVEVPVPVLTEEDRRILKDAIDKVAEVGKAFALLAPVMEKVTASPLVSDRPAVPYPQRRPAAKRPDVQAAFPRIPDMVTAPKGRLAVAAAQGLETARHLKESSNGRVSVPQQKILDALAWFESIGVDSARRPPLAAVAGVSSKSSGFRANVSTLSGLGLIRYPGEGRVQLTEEGRAQAELPDREPTLQALHEAISGMVSRPQADLLAVLLRMYPDSISREELAERAGVSSASSGFRANVSTLSGFELLVYPAPGMVRAADLLFPEGLS